MAYISAAESIRISSTTFTQSAQKATEFGEITQPLGLLRRSKSLKVTELGTNRKPICDFLLGLIVTYLLSCTVSEISLHFSTTFWFNPPTEGFPWDDLRKILPGCIKWRRNNAENFNRLSRVHERYRQTTDRQTDRRQTDGRRHIANVNMSSRSLKTVEGVER